MADASKTIELIFQGVDKTAAATQAALRNLESFSGGVKQVTQPVADFTLGAATLEAGLLTTGVAMTAFAVTRRSWTMRRAARSRWRTSRTRCRRRSGRGWIGPSRWT